MAYIKNPTVAQKQEWAKQAALQEDYVKDLILKTAVSYEDNPTLIAEMLSFGSKFYKYSVKNNMLVLAQNPNATYVQSYAAWKKMGNTINKGSKGMKVYTPVKVTMLKVGDKLVPLEQASKEEKIKYHAGEIESVTQTHFKVGNVFDIAQTNFPKEDYPKLFSMGYDSKFHSDIVKGLTDFATNALGCSVSFENLESIALRGNFTPKTNEIRINEKLEDTEKLSTLSHELGHSILHKQLGKSMQQKEFEADAISIMLQSHFGVDLTDSRKRHLAKYYQAYQNQLARTDQKIEIFDILDAVYKSYRSIIDGVDKCVAPYISQGIQEKQWMNESKSVPAYRRTPSEKQVEFTQSIAQTIGKELPDLADGIAVSAFISQNKNMFNQIRNQMVTDQIKSKVSILDYANMHGIQLKKVGTYYTMLDHDSVRIDPLRNCFWRNSGIGQNTKGSVIDFAMAFVTDGDKPQALEELSQIAGETNLQSVKLMQSQTHNAASANEQKPKTLILPPRNKNMKRVFAYLLKTRYIDQDVVQDFVDRKMLYQDTKDLHHKTEGNCVFVAYDEEQKPNFACLRGTLSDVKFMGDISGSDYSRDFYINNHKDKMIVTESVIDAMSVMSILKGQQIDYKDYDYLVLAGTEKYESLLTHLQEASKREVLLALDNDDAGKKSISNIQYLLEKNQIETQLTVHAPETKDWNQDLVKVASKFKNMDLIPFLENSEVIFPEVTKGLNTAAMIPATEQTPEDHSFQIKGFHIEDAICMAEVVYKGEKVTEALCKEGENYYVTTGMAFDDTLEKHWLSDSDFEMYEKFIDDLGEQYTETDIAGIIQLSNTAQDIQSYLKSLQQQELKKNAAVPEPVMMMGVEMEM